MQVNVVPIFKKRKKDLDNYQPTCLTLGNVLDQIINQSVHEHLERKVMITKSQPAFLKKPSSQKTVLSFYDKGLAQ